MNRINTALTGKDIYGRLSSRKAVLEMIMIKQ